MASNQTGANPAPTGGAGSTPATGGKKTGGLSGMLSGLAGKAQGHLAGFSVNELPHSMRQAGAQWDPRQSAYTLALQLLIKAHKGVVVDTEALGRETHSLSKQLYLWSVDENEAGRAPDLQDVGDRLAFLTYKSGDLEMEYAKALEKARLDLKDIRNFENDLTKSRDRRKNLEGQLSKLQSDPKPKADQHEKITSLTSELHQVVSESSTYESSLEQLKRSKLRSAFATHFQAMREYGEKMALLSGYGELLLQELEDGRPASGRSSDQSPGEGYDGKERTAWIRGAAAESLANYRGPLVPRPTIGDAPLSGAGAQSNVPSIRADSLTDTRSFGETHHNELASLHSPAPGAGPPASPFGEPPSQTHPSTSSINHAPVLPGASPSSTTATPPQLPARHGGSLAAPGQGQASGGSGSDIFATPTGIEDDKALAPPPVGAHPTVAEIGGAVPQGTGGPASGQLPSRNSKAQEAAADAGQGGGMGYQDAESGLGRTATTSRRPGEDLPAYSIEDSRPQGQ